MIKMQKGLQQEYSDLETIKMQKGLQQEYRDCIYSKSIVNGKW